MIRIKNRRKNNKIGVVYIICFTVISFMTTNNIMSFDFNKPIEVQMTYDSKLLDKITNDLENDKKNKIKQRLKSDVEWFFKKMISKELSNENFKLFKKGNNNNLKDKLISDFIVEYKLVGVYKLELIKNKISEIAELFIYDDTRGLSKKFDNGLDRVDEELVKYGKSTRYVFYGSYFDDMIRELSNELFFDKSNFKNLYIDLIDLIIDVKNVRNKVKRGLGYTFEKTKNDTIKLKVINGGCKYQLGKYNGVNLETHNMMAFLNLVKESARCRAFARNFDITLTKAEEGITTTSTPRGLIYVKYKNNQKNKDFLKRYFDLYFKIDYPNAKKMKLSDFDDLLTGVTSYGNSGRYGEDTYEFYLSDICNYNQLVNQSKKGIINNISDVTQNNRYYLTLDGVPLFSGKECMTTPELENYKINKVRARVHIRFIPTDNNVRFNEGQKRSSSSFDN